MWLFYLFIVGIVGIFLASEGIPGLIVSYVKYSIPFIIKVFKGKTITGLSLTRLLDYIADFSETETGYIELSINRLYSFRVLLDKAIQKLLMARNYREFFFRTQKCKEWKNERIKVFLEFCEDFECCKVSPSIRGPCGLSYDFYLDGGSFRRNSFFLFGTPSQFRIQN